MWSVHLFLISHMMQNGTRVTWLNFYFFVPFYPLFTYKFSSLLIFSTWIINFRFGCFFCSFKWLGILLSQAKGPFFSNIKYCFIMYCMIFYFCIMNVCIVKLRLTSMVDNKEKVIRSKYKRLF